jgi:hypothetical protein
LKPTNFDCAENLRDIDKKTKKLTYSLKRLVADKEKHIELKDGMPEDIDVLESTHLLVKIFTQGKLSPARIEIQYGPGQVVPGNPQKVHSKKC